MILKGLRRIDGRAGYVLTTNGRTPVSGFSNAKTAIDKVVARNGESPVPHWTLHDLRRTVATNLQKLGVRFEVTEAVLNHRGGSKSGVAGIYQRYEWRDEKRAALDAWARRLDAIVTGDTAPSNVLSIGAGRR